jgi:hypothetical protein
MWSDRMIPWCIWGQAGESIIAMRQFKIADVFIPGVYFPSGLVVLQPL